MNWMLVLFMGVSPHYNVVKTDLIFSDQVTINKAVEWAGMQRPRGTCIPTTSKVTLF